MVTSNVHPSMVKVTQLSDAFLKKAHKIMRDKGYKLQSGVQSAAIDWVYIKEGCSDVFMDGWHGRDPHKWGGGKTIWGINKVDFTKGTFENEFKILNVMDVELTPNRKQMLPEAKIKEYEENLIKAEEYLKSI